MRPASTRIPTCLRWIPELVARVEAESAAYRRSVPPAVAVRKVAVVLVTTALTLTLLHFLAPYPSWVAVMLRALGADGVAARWEALMSRGATGDLGRLVFWAGFTALGYWGAAWLALRLLGERMRDHGARLQGALRRAWVYVVVFLLSLPFLVAASTHPDFLVRYPFLRLGAGDAWWPALAIWWVAYACQFVALELFFRGFLLHGLRQQFGIGAVFVMVVPYAMIHFAKPLPEALAAIAGGTVLGFLSLETGAVWLGAALHVAIALTMDLLALARGALG